MIYLDHNATTPVRPEVAAAMQPFLGAEFGNPNSVYKAGQRARAAVEDARRRVAALLSCSEEEVVFTSGGSESDVLALSGAAWQAFEDTRGKRRRIVISAVEHDAVREQAALLARRGFAVDVLPVDRLGRVDTEAASALVGPETAVVSVMHSNNEVGTLQPVERLAALCRARGVLMHTDAVQSAGKVALDARALGVDLLSISGHKLNAPKGVGALFVRRGARISPVITGHQEKNRRGGTENVAGIVGLGAACALASPGAAAGRALIARVIEAVAAIPETRRNGDPAECLPNCAHFSFRGLDGHHLVVALDLEGICVSSGPACASGSSVPSHVLTAMGVEPAWATGSLRVSVGWGTKEADVDRFLEVLPGAVERLRRLPAGVS